MSVVSPERVDPGTEGLTFEQAEFDIVCDVASLRSIDSAYPKCPGDPARWVGWRTGCSPGCPQYRLLCDHCKKHYQALIAKYAYLTCGVCGEQSDFVAFTPLEGAS